MTMVRPRAGGFCYTEVEFETAKADARALLLGGAACVAGTEIGRRVHPHTLRRFYTVCALSLIHI